ncbi:hypothetical protein PP182_08925 [Maribacter sp. PR1]|uniref:Uncharacterized protein n=1 Tax=Maribacter cobaltidurans TaxID=1178778 RepID=A0ABU7IT87_9FLAO|nr:MULTISPECIES: hypothetical protein [Maribacter]MDC6388803.1 hypothetical protein [Maribacter sp. PR1]MEE1976192.1 hypothetical protein [Maribacter cobaltidurans]
MKKYFVLLFALGLSLGCEENKIDCSLVLCEGPPVFLFEVMNNDKNVIENGTYSIDDITIDGTNANIFILVIQTWETASGEKTGVVLDNNSWEPKVYKINLNLASDFKIPIEIDMGLSEAESCCGGIPRVNGIVIDGERQPLNNGIFFTIDIE